MTTHEKEEICNIFAAAIRNELPPLPRKALQKELGKKVLTTAEVRAQYGISNQRQYHLRKDKKVSFIQDGGKIYYRREVIENYMDDYTISGDY